MKRKTPYNRITGKNSRSWTFSDRSGLTLLETMAALAVLTIGIAGVLHAFSASIAATKSAETYSTASVLANQVASELERQTDLSEGPQSGTFEDETNYEWSANVEAADENGLMRTTIEISWDTKTNPKHYDMIVFLKPSDSTTTTTTPDNSSGGT